MRLYTSLLAITACFGPIAAIAQPPAPPPPPPAPSTLVALQYGAGFRDSSLGLSSYSGRVGTLLVDLLQPIRLGDHAITIRVFQADFDATGGQPVRQQMRAYAEWNARLRLHRWASERTRRSFEISAATEFQRASMWRGSEYVGVAFTYRQPGRFARLTPFYQLPLTASHEGYRLRANWGYSLGLGSVHLLFDGAENVSTSRWRTLDVFGLPSASVDIGEHLHQRPRTLWAGVEVMHRHTADARLTATQGVIRWTP